MSAGVQAELGDVFSFHANAFTFRPNVFTLAGEVRGKRGETGEKGNLGIAAEG